ncbi:hypothetical protein [Promicromonospora sp. NPDC057488]|uniref:hypothetical protein n=1 Tax=Promicromonospora sp. NPDC057488 TaxID=3346147 RepID=UPI00366ECF32
MTAVDTAARHALQGRYDAARHLLEDLGGQESDDVEVVDLLARVHAQTGDLRQADTCWARVERLDPEHLGAREGRRKIHEIWSGRRPGILTAAGAAGLSVLLVATGAAISWSVSASTEPVHGDAATAEQLASLREDMAQLATNLPADPTPPPPSDDATNRLRTIQDDLADPQWAVTRTTRSVVVTFRDPVFQAGGADTTTDGADALTDLAARLADLTATTLTVVGHTSSTTPVATSPYTSNAEVGLARALAAAQVISDGGGIPLGALDLATAGDTDPPHPGTNQARNQTVTVTIELLP